MEKTVVFVLKNFDFIFSEIFFNDHVGPAACGFI